MQKVGDKLVYNRNGLASAKAYAEKNNESEVLRKVNSIYKKLKLDKEESALIKEKYSKEGFTCFAYDETNAYLAKDGKIFSHPLFANEEEMEFAEDKVEEMALMAKVGTEEDDKTVKMSAEEFEAINVKMAEMEKEKEEMEA